MCKVYLPMLACVLSLSFFISTVQAQDMYGAIAYSSDGSWG